MFSLATPGASEKLCRNSLAVCGGIMAKLIS
jgi:hypothetical protein